MTSDSLRSPLALSIDAAAASLGIARVSMRRRIADGTIRAVRIGGRLVVPLTELERLLAGEPRARAGGAT
jgi:excisionase family DNA binding protein